VTFVLRACDGPTRGTLYRLTADETRIGRDPHDCHLVLPDDATSVSRLHVTLQLDRINRTVWLRDEGSKNGTWVDGVGQLDAGQEVALAVGTRFRLGEASIAFELITQSTPLEGA
jgi:pSer/pThr/pTyr-binding forkhead associated (FHA) protein